MLIGIGASIYSGHRYDAAISSANLAARFDANTGITSSGGVASAWADQSGNARPLLQATGANQPIHLPFIGTKYAQTFGVVGNYFSTPDSVSNSITSDLAIVIDLAPDLWANGNQSPIGKIQVAATKRSYFIQIENTKQLALVTSVDGTSATDVIGRSSAAITFADGQRVKLAATLDVDNGSAQKVHKFFTSIDAGSTWQQLGTTQTSAGTTSIFDSDSIVEIGGVVAGTAQLLKGKIYSAQIYNGIPPMLGGAGSVSPVIDFDPSRWSSGTTFTASTGETWTINSTGAKPAQIVDRPSLLFDGAAHKMATADFGLVQPYVRILAARTPTHTVGDVLADGLTLNTGALRQTTASPKLSINAGASACETDMMLGAWKVITAVVNGASSSLRENLGTPTTGDVGAGNPGGLMIGADGAGLNYGNLQYTDELVYSAVPSEAVLQNIIRTLMNKRGIA